jgi:hypothetical protein
VCSSHIASALIGRPSAVESNMKSSAHTWFRRTARSRFVGTVLVPTRRRFWAYGLTRKPSSRHNRCTRLRFTTQPSRRSSVWANRYPYRGQSLEISRSRIRSCCSGASTGRGGRRCVVRLCPIARHALRSDTPNRSHTWRTASRRQDGLRSFPGPPPSAPGCRASDPRPAA